MISIKKKSAALALSAVTAFAGIGMLLGESKALSVNAEEEITETASAQITATESTTDTTSTLETPTLVKGANEDHYCFGVYTVTQEDVNGSYIGFKKGANEQYDAFTLSVTYEHSAKYIVTSSSSDITCTPTCQVCRAYNPSKTITSAYNQYLRDSNNYVKAEKTTTGKTSSGTSMSTSWNATGFVWEHGADSSKKIYFSFAYNGYTKDEKIEIPWIGYVTSTAFTLDGVTFQVRTGPNKVSIKASESGVYCNSYDTMFAFYAGD